MSGHYSEGVLLCQRTSGGSCGHVVECPPCMEQTAKTYGTALAECRVIPQECTSVAELLRATSRTFALSIENLPEPLREEIAVAYLLFRISDYFEDHPDLCVERKVELLRLWERALAAEEEVPALLREVAAMPHAADDPEAEVACAAGSLLTRLAAFDPAVRAAITDRVRETSRGMAARQLKGPQVADESELDSYMHDVAGVVGYLVTDLFALHFRAVAERQHLLMPLAREFGLALQAVNILRGLRKDYERGWVFVPQTLCASYGLHFTDLFRHAHEATAMRVVHDLATKAEGHLRSGLRYVQLIPRHLHRVRLACLWPLLFAAATLGVTRNNPAVLHGEAKISRALIARIVRQTTLLGWSNAWISGMTERLLTARG